MNLSTVILISNSSCISRTRASSGFALFCLRMITLSSLLGIKIPYTIFLVNVEIYDPYDMRENQD
jgi:hypothetical protein